jgi:hypothetical protein
MKKPSTSGAMVDLFVLLFIVISVQTVWATMIRPHAEAIRAADLERMMHDRTTCRRSRRSSS